MALNGSSNNRARRGLGIGVMAASALAAAAWRHQSGNGGQRQHNKRISA